LAWPGGLVALKRSLFLSCKRNSALLIGSAHREKKLHILLEDLGIKIWLELDSMYK